jgi:predicted amidohydrolase YtcJ
MWGSLEPGKLADLLILDRDIHICPEDAIRETHPIQTFLGGEIVFMA